MKILIVEDELPTAEDIELIIRRIINNQIITVDIISSLSAAKIYLSENHVDLLLLDLNLNGKDGYDLMKSAVANSFFTIVISAYSERAIEAFEYGVLDFVTKPYTPQRIQKAINRYIEFGKDSHPKLKYLSIKKGSEIEIIKISEIKYFKGASNYSVIHLKNGKTKISEKNLQRLEMILPAHFRRVHKSYIADESLFDKLHNHGAGKYEAELITGDVIPISRNRYQEILEYLSGYQLCRLNK